MSCLKWQLTWGEHVKLLEKRARQGKPTPAWSNRPIIEDDLIWIWNGFQLLHRARSVNGWAPAPISLSDILAWFEISCIFDPEDRLEAFHHIMALDDGWVSWARKKSKEKVKDGDSPTSD